MPDYGLYQEWFDDVDRVRTEEVQEQVFWDAYWAASSEAAETAREKAVAERRARVASSGCSDPCLGRFAHKCRRCASCLAERSRSWVARAKQEFFAHERCWWITLTYRGSVEEHYDEVQKWLKRIRASGYPLRFLCSEETGERGGRLHWHMLLFCEKRLSKRLLERLWRRGFSRLRLARTVGLAAYMAKYCGKSVGRMRASVGFGNAERCLLKGRPDLYAEYDGWRFGGGAIPDFVEVWEGSLNPVRFHSVGRWWLVPPF